MASSRLTARFQIWDHSPIGMSAPNQEISHPLGCRLLG